MHHMQIGNKFYCFILPTWNKVFLLLLLLLSLLKA